MTVAHLDKTITDGKKLPRWDSRSKRQVFVGMSQKHASTVPLVLNLDTGAITPQFHCIRFKFPGRLPGILNGFFCVLDLPWLR